MIIEYPFVNIHGRWFLIGIVAYIIITILTMIVYYKKVPAIFHRIREVIIREKKKCFGKLAICSVIVAAILCIRVSKIPNVYGTMDGICEVIVRIDLLCVIFYLYILYRQNSYKNEKAAQPVLEAFLLITILEIFICLWWKGTDKIIFRLNYIPNIICLLVLLFIWFLSQIILESYFMLKDRQEIEEIGGMPHLARNNDLEAIICKILMKQSKTSISIIIEGEKGSGKKNFIDFMIKKLHDGKQDVIKVEIDISKLKDEEEIVQNFSDKLQEKLEEMKVYFGPPKKNREICGVVFENLQLKKPFKESIKYFFENYSKRVIQINFEDFLKTEYVFVILTGIDNESVGKAFYAIRRLKKFFTYSRGVILAVWDTEVFDSMSENHELKLNEKDILKVFDEKVSLKPIGYKKVFEDNQNKDIRMWKISNSYYIDINKEFAEMKKDMDVDLKYTYSKMDMDYDKIKKRFADCREVLEQELNKFVIAISLYNNLYNDMGVLKNMMKRYPLDEQERFLEEYQCFRVLLILNIIKVTSPEEYREMCKKGIEQYIDKQNWEIMDNFIVFGMLYLLKKANSFVLKKRKEFMIGFLDGEIDRLFENRQDVLKHYEILLKNGNYELINIEDMLKRVLKKNMSEINNEASNMIRELFVNVLPWQIKNQKKSDNFPFDLLVEMFGKNDWSDFIVPNLGFWESFNEFMKNEKCHLADLKYVKELQINIIKAYIPLTFRYFKDLFEYNNVEIYLEDAEGVIKIPKIIEEVNLDVEIRMFVEDYKSYFPNITYDADSIITLKNMLSQCEEDLCELCESMDEKCLKVIKMAEMQWKELKSLKEVIDAFLYPEIDKLIKNQNFIDLASVIWDIANINNECFVKEKWQIASLIEKKVKNYDMSLLNKNEKKKVLSAVIEFENLYDVDLRSAKIEMRK